MFVFIYCDNLLLRGDKICCYIRFRVKCVDFLSLHGAAPEYLRGCCIGTRSSASGLRLRSLEKTDLRVRRMRTHFGDRAFSVGCPRWQNILPPAIRLADSVDSFKVQLKTYLFAKSHPVQLLVRHPCSAIFFLLFRRLSQYSSRLPFCLFFGRFTSPGSFGYFSPSGPP